MTGFDFDSETRRRLGYKLIDRIDEYFSSLPDQPVQLPSELRTFADLTNRLPELGENAEKVLDDVCSEVVMKGFHVPSANYFAKIEKETVRWIGERVGWNKPFDGTFTSGGNEANFSALALALAAHFPQAIEEGVAGIGARPVLYTSAEAHHSIDKSAGLLGLGRKALRRIPVNANIQLDPSHLEAQIGQDKSAGLVPFCVVATAGTTNSGAVDDLVALAAICKRHQLWLHLDGAYGAAAIFSDQHRDLVRGIDLADSITIDPHKWLAMPFAAGVILTSHPETLQQAFGVSTPYMPRVATQKTSGPTPLDNFQVSTQWSRRTNSLKLWLTLRVHGRQAYEELIDRQLKLAAYFANCVRSSQHFELAAPQVLPIVNFRVKLPGASDEQIRVVNQAIVQEVTHDGRRWISTTLVNGKSVIRVMVISYLTGHRHLEDLMIALTEAVKRQVSATAGRI